MQSHQRHGKTLVLKLRYGDFITITKRRTFSEFIPNDAALFEQYAEEIFEEVVDGHFDSGIRLLEIHVNRLGTTGIRELNVATLSE